MIAGGARGRLRGGLVERGLPHPRARGGPPEGRPRRVGAVPRRAARARQRRSPPTSSASSRSISTATGSAAGGTASTSNRSSPRPGIAAPAVAVVDRRTGGHVADVVEPTLPLLPPRAGHDHRLQVERRPGPGGRAEASPGVAPADDLRDGLRGDDRPAARRGPAPVPRDRGRRAGAGRRQAARQGPREDRRRRPPGSGPARSSRRPTSLACTYCPYRDICPASAVR